MRSFRVRRVAPLLAVLLLSLVNSGCPELNRQPDYMGKQIISIEAPLPAIAAVQPASPARQAFDHGSSIMSN